LPYEGHVSKDPYVLDHATNRKWSKDISTSWESILQRNGTV